MFSDTNRPGVALVSHTETLAACCSTTPAICTYHTQNTLTPLQGQHFLELETLSATSLCFSQTTGLLTLHPSFRSCFLVHDQTPVSALLLLILETPVVYRFRNAWLCFYPANPDCWASSPVLPYSASFSTSPSRDSVSPTTTATPASVSFDRYRRD